MTNHSTIQSIILDKINTSLFENLTKRFLDISNNTKKVENGWKKVVLLQAPEIWSKYTTPRSLLLTHMDQKAKKEKRKGP